MRSDEMAVEATTELVDGLMGIAGILPVHFRPSGLCDRCNLPNARILEAVKVKDGVVWWCAKCRFARSFQIIDPFERLRPAKLVV